MKLTIKITNEITQLSISESIRVAEFYRMLKDFLKSQSVNMTESTSAGINQNDNWSGFNIEL